ncbi:conserved hypothetical protein (plasmid) [Borreliella garinii Far04]|nr:conserved hypothetical protein [Borreliella garinii Far04]
MTSGNYLGFYFFIIIKFFSAILLLRARTPESNKSYSPFSFAYVLQTTKNNNIKNDLTMFLFFIGYYYIQ